MRTGIRNVAPWQPVTELALMAAPFGTWMTFVPGGIVMLKPVVVGTETPEVVQPDPPTTVTVEPFSERPVKVSELLLGLSTSTRRSALEPG
jgi:hypothetical protein